MSKITYTRITPNGEERCEMLTTEDKLTRIKAHHMGAASCETCGLELGKTCPIKLWADWTDEEIEAAYAIITNPVNFVKVNADDEVEPENDAVESDAVNHPNHYTQNGIECIEAIRASMTDEGFCDYCKGNIIKYLWRWRDKGGVEDLRKARVYLDWLIEEAEK